MLSRKYEYLARENGPKMLAEALRLHGTRETAGPGNTPEIMAWAREMGGDLARVFTADAIPWCGLFMAIVAKRAGKPDCVQPLWARAWASWGQASPRASLGDVLVFVRRGGGHVGIYVGDDGTHYHVLGGNQGNAVSIIRIAKARCIAVRRFYRIAPPANVRPIRLAASGPVSTNEA